MKGWQKTSFVDFEDNVVSTFFYGGCNFRCPFCHNRDLVLNPQELPDIDEDQAIQYLAKKRALYDGVCVSGGEPTLVPNLQQTLEKIKATGLKVKLDTNGSQFEIVKKLVSNNLVDYIALDIKTSPEKYLQIITSQKPEEVFQNIKATMDYLKTSGEVDYEFRSTLFPPFFEEDDLPEIATLLKGAKRYYLQAFNPKVTLGNTEGITPFDGQKMEELRKYFSQSVKVCEIR